MGKNDMDEEEDLDISFLDNVLNKLYDFGDGSKMSKSKKNQKRKRCEEEEVEVTAANDEDCEIQSIVDERLAAGQESTSAIISAESAPSSKHQSQVEIVTFQEPKKASGTQRKLTAPLKNMAAPQKKMLPPVKETKRNEDAHTLSLEKSRLEVHRLGLTGYRKEQQRGFEAERAVMLGAWPPKKEYVNYKVYQQTVKDRKQKAKEQQSAELKPSRKSSRPREEEKRKKIGSAPSGLVGRFKNGMLVLNAKDLQKIKGSH